jgi:hypothetical protein
VAAVPLDYVKNSTSSRDHDNVRTDVTYAVTSVMIKAVLDPTATQVGRRASSDPSTKSVEGNNNADTEGTVPEFRSGPCC